MQGRSAARSDGDRIDWSRTPIAIRYRRFLRASGRASTTVQERVGDVSRFHRSMGDLAAITSEDVITYMTVVHAESLPEYRKKIRSSLRVFYSWALDEGLVLRDPTARLPRVHVPRAHPHPIPDDILLGAYEHASLPVRAMLLLGGAIGLRRSEIAAAHPQHRNGHRLTVRGKGGRTRIVPLDDLTYITLGELESSQGAESFYFPGRFGGAIHASTAYKWVRNELGPEWSLHSLRHRAATLGYRGTKDLRATQEFLGHSSPSTTQIYVEVSDDALEAVVAASAFPQTRHYPESSDIEPLERVSTFNLKDVSLEDLFRLLSAARGSSSNAEI